MWFLLPIAGLAGMVGYSKYKKAGGYKGMGKKAGIEAAKAMSEGLRDEAKSIANDVLNYSKNLGHSITTAKAAAAIAISKLGVK